MNVAFCGHDKVNNAAELSEWLDTILPKLVEQGAKTFFFTCDGEFDSLAAQAVKKLKPQNPDICSFAALPTPLSDVRFDQPRRKAFDHDLYDFCIYSSQSSDVPLSRAVILRNEWLARDCDIIVSAVEHDRDNAAKTLDVAMSRGKIIIHFPDTEVEIDK